MPRLIPRPVSVTFCRFTRNTEISNQRLTGGKFTFVLRKPDRLAGCIQSGGVPTIKTMNHRTTPLLYRSFTHRSIKAVPFKRCVICVFQRPWIRQCFNDFIRNFFSAHEVYNFNRRIVHLIGEQQYLKVRGLCIFIRPCFGDTHAAPRLYINAQMSYHHGSSCSKRGLYSPR